jgi:hypothetical protein
MPKETGDRFSKVDGVNFETILHELVHQATQAATEYPSKADEKTWEVIKSLENLRARIRKEINQRSNAGEDIDYYVRYGTKNIQELLAVGFTDRKFQKFMESISYSARGKKTLWDKFAEGIRKLLNIPAKQGTVFSEFLLQSGRITKLSEKQIKPLLRGKDLQGGADFGPPAAEYSEIINKPGSLQDQIDALQVRLMPLESEMRQEGGVMSSRNQAILFNKINNIKKEISDLESQQETQESINRIYDSPYQREIDEQISDIEGILAQQRSLQGQEGHIERVRLEAKKDKLEKAYKRLGDEAIEFTGELRKAGYRIDWSDTIKDRYGYDVQRYWFHNPGKRKIIDPGKSTAHLKAYDELNKGQFKGQPYKKSRVLWLSRDPYGELEDNFIIDFKKLQGKKKAEEFFTNKLNEVPPGTVAETGQAEGNMFYGGNLPASAIVKREGVPPEQLAMFSRRKRFASDSNTSANKKLTEATEKAVESVKQTPRGEIPHYNVNASDVALEAAINFNEDITANPPPRDIPNYSRGTLPPELADDIIRTGHNPGQVKSLGATLLETINNPIESIAASFKHFRQNYIDKLDKVEKKILQGSIENEEVRLANLSADTGTMAAMRLADKARGIFQGMLMRGYATDKIQGIDALTNTRELEIDTKYNPFIDGNKGTGGLMQIMSPLYADPTVDLEGVFGYYAKTMRIKKMEDNGRVIDSPITEKDKAHLELIRRKYPAVVEVYNNYQKWNNKLIEFAEAKGLLNAEQANMWREHSSYYPFYRDMVDDSGLAAPTIGGGSLPSNPLNIKMKGSEREIAVNPVEAIARNSLSILTGAMKNDGTSKLLRDLQLMGEAEYLDSPEKVKAERNKIFVFEDGQKKYYKVDDTELFHGIQAIGGVKTDTVTKFLAMPSSLLRDTVTRDPGFVVVNLLRDTLSATVTSGAPLGGEGFTPVIDTVKNMFADMSDLEKFGVIGGYDFQNDEGSVVQLMERARRQQGLSPDNGISAKDGFFKLWDGLGALTTKSDGATRLAVYNAVYNDMKNRGFNEAQAQSEAAYQSLEIINFGRRGLSPIFRMITAAIPFFNARIQGLDVLYRSATGKYSAIDKLEAGETIDDVKNRIIRKFGLRAGTMMGLTLLYYLMVSDTDEYKEAKREVRDDNWIIPNGTKYPIKIPIPFEVGMLFKAIPERLIDMAMGEDAVEKSPLKSITRQLGTSAQIPFFEPSLGIQALKPFVEVLANRNSFTDTEIVPYYKLKELPAYQARQSTNEVARILGEALNISPMKIEHVLTGYTGTLGGYALNIMDVFARSVTGTPIMPPNINDIPVIKRLFFDLDKAGGLQQQFYELREVVDGAVLTLNDLRRQKRFDELAAFREHNKGVFQVKGQVRAIERYMTNWRRRRDNLLRRNDIGPLAKSDMLRQMELERDKRLAILPALKERADVPAISLGN